jgi:hypothetical protein
VANSMMNSQLYFSLFLDTSFLFLSRLVSFGVLEQLFLA